MKAKLLLLSALFSATMVVAQSTDTTYWKKGFLGTLTINQVALKNWQAGGNSSYSWNALVILYANYEKDNWAWSNNLQMGIGYQFQNDITTKTDDRFEFTTNVGYKSAKNWHYMLFGQFRTQYFDGFAKSEDTVRISTFLAPAYTILGLGMEYKPDDKFRLYLSPVTIKHTYVRDSLLASQGAFGVTPGENGRIEAGAYLNTVWLKEEIVKNVTLRTKLDLFANYLENVGNVDINAEVFLLMKINNWLSASFMVQMIYDDDIKIDTGELASDGSPIIGPRAQWRQVLGVGLTARLQSPKSAE